MSVAFGKFVFYVTLALIVSYIVWYYKVGERRMVNEALAGLSGGQRLYLSEKPSHIILSSEQKERLMQKKGKRLLKMIAAFVLMVVLAAISSQRMQMIGIVLLAGCMLYFFLKGHYNDILSGEVYGVKAVCISATHPTHGKGRFMYTYRFAYYDFKRSMIEGAIMATERGDMSISLGAGAQTTLVVREKDGRLKVLDWAGWLDLED